MSQPPTNPLYWYRAVCGNVVDGDTVDTTIDLGFRMNWGPERIRLWGINAYELTDPDSAKRDLAQQGKTYLSEKILGKNVLLNSFKDSKDKYGRWLAVIYYQNSDGTWSNVNQELIEKGLALQFMT